MATLKTTKSFSLIAVLALTLFSPLRLFAQPGYSQPNPYQPGYAQPDQYQPGYPQSDQQYQPGYSQPGYDVPVESFYDELAPYGQWRQYPGYGNAWVPNAGPDFQPYASNGHWVMTEYGNTWVSDYDWGWAPFHYGRWTYDPAYGGWLWIPGREWAPAWVSWRSGGGYYGWAPLGPGININVNINIPAPYWTFVPQVYITSPRLYSYYVPRPRVVNIYQQTTIINNYYRRDNRAYAYGPNRYDIERVTRQRVPVYRIETVNRPGRAVVGNGAVGFYRPGSGTSSQPGYGRNDRYNTPNRPDYSNNNASGRGAYRSPATPSNREYSRNNGAGVGYDGTNNGAGRGNYGSTPDAGSSERNRPQSSRGSYSSGSVPQEANAPQDIPAPNRSDMNRGGFSTGNATQTDNASRQNRTYNRAERQEPAIQQATPGGRYNGATTSAGRGSVQEQRSQEQPQRSNSSSSGGEGRSRGPR